MDAQSNSERVHWLLYDLCTQFGFCSAVREPEKFERLVSEGADTFADAMLTAEGLAPDLHKQIRRKVRAFVVERFDKWGGA